MMEKLGQAKTHLELKKMIAEVDTNNSGEDFFYFTCACCFRLEGELGGREGETERRERGDGRGRGGRREGGREGGSNERERERERERGRQLFLYAL